MASPAVVRENEGMQIVPVGLAAEDNSDHHMAEITRRLMRVKVLYTFDDQNKSNCLARVPHPLNIPTVSLDETTQLGVVELKSCIEAIVTASPELVAKLGHDYTVYAYDYSEYETPLVGQGLLSRILASASPTPNAPAEQSETMVTGRVCKNLLGLFSNGIKETLEVKLRLVPVPTCMQKEYVENMERYHSLSRLMPDGFDYSAWSDFLQANPTIAQLAQSTPQPELSHGPSGEISTFHQMLPGSMGMGATNPTYQDSSNIQYGNYGARPSSPAMSTVSYAPSYIPYAPTQESRPASRASFYSEPQPQRQDFQAEPTSVQEQQDDGPPKKRARTTRASRPRKAVLGVNNDSLRVTASTAASVRLHRPAVSNPAIDMASADQGPRAPTPRPGDKYLAQNRGSTRTRGASSLRHASMDEARPHVASFDSGIFSDNAIDSADDERGISPGETMDIPSSPPIMHQRVASSVPSSPGLPSLPYPADSGFASELSQRREEEADNGGKQWEKSDLPDPPTDTRIRRKQDRSHQPWTEVNPGPVELLPKSYVPKPKTYPRSRPSGAVDKLDKVAEEVHQPQQHDTVQPHIPSTDQSNLRTPNDSNAATATNQDARRLSGSTALPSVELLLLDQFSQAGHLPVVRPSVATVDISVPTNEQTSQHVSRSATPNAQPRRSKSTKAKGLPRSNTWSGEPMSDSIVPGEFGTGQPRSGSGARRKQNIVDKLEQSLQAQKMPDYCNNCGEIETPLWRKAYMRVEDGTPDNIIISSKGTGIAAVEMIYPPPESNEPIRHRIFKQILEPHERDSNVYQVLTLCNPCGLWLGKKNCMRPPDVFTKGKPQANGDKPKRKRNPPKGSRKRDEVQSDAVVPPSDADIGTPYAQIPASLDGMIDAPSQHPMMSRESSFRAPSETAISQMNGNSAAIALQRAILSSPPGFHGSKNSPIEVDPDLTPKPTRRLLFPSPRRNGMVKSLSEGGSLSPTVRPTTTDVTKSPMKRTLSDMEDTDKENCPPPPYTDADDDFAHLFEDCDQPLSPKTTPTKGSLPENLMNTPTPGSRRRVPLTPKRAVESGVDLLNLFTPSKNNLTPNRNGRAVTMAPETPFTRRLNALMSNCITSPSQPIDLSDLPSFDPTTGHAVDSHFCDFVPEDFWSSDMPIPSSSPGDGPGFLMYEDPATSTVGIWSGPSVFGGSDPIGLEDVEHHDHQPQQTQHSQPETQQSVPTETVISVKLAAMIEEVVGASEGRQKSPQQVETPVAGTEIPTEDSKQAL
ncbi:hypothetical protein B0J11DRAFT_521920 [Dendryphion nanum]|uniref:Ams2/SPT21 N-terminal domain-containing protein n=1 Tax=Dendryphion nanum TaxID=256645 RepID=A0A9P9IVQ7_9PLEO|nr:hypothetical protein B0J11DRAFT_521920 [Dendryphion nanum]